MNAQRYFSIILIIVVSGLISNCISSEPLFDTLVPTSTGTSQTITIVTLVTSNIPSPTSTPTFEPATTQIQTAALPPIPLETSTPKLGKDGMPLILIPAGEFTMGSYDGDADEGPVHKVFLDDFLIDQTEVTNSMYLKFLNNIVSEISVESQLVKYKGNPILSLLCNDCTNWTDRIIWNESAFSLIEGYEGHPVVLVTWYGADAYCTWAGRKLPTEAQWEKAARGTDQFIYPWGNNPIECSLANYNDCAGSTTRVGSYIKGASPYGVLDMAGNVWEWVGDWHSYNYYAASPEANPLGPETGQYRVRRGGAWGGSGEVARSSNRGDDKTPEDFSDNMGFRCASVP